MFRTLHKAAVGVALAGLTILASASPASAAANFPNFRVGIQAMDKGTQVGDIEFTNYASFGASCSPWAGDTNTYDPDGVSVALQNAPRGLLGAKDFRIGVQVTDNNQSQTGLTQWTPWASAGGGVSAYAFDGNGYDPDQFRICVDVRPMPTNVELYDFRLSVKVVDRGTADQGGFRQFTPWSGDGGGSSAFAVDRNSYDPDGIAVGIEVY